MQLTERQCWKVIRDLVVGKNKEYSAFLVKMLDASQCRELQGYTREAFLSKFDFYSLDDFYNYATSKNNGRESNGRWLENLSSEDLILFLDFRCKILQQVYDFYKANRGITKNNIKDIVKATKISKLASYNGVRLNCGSKPRRVDGELKNSELELTQTELRELALSQVITGMANKLIVYKNISIEQAQRVTSSVVTTNIDINGERTGHKLNKEIRPTKQSQFEDNGKRRNNDIEMSLLGYDENGLHIFMLNGQKVDFFKNPIPNAVVVYDQYMNLIKDEEEIKPKFVGFNIQGTPVYEYDGRYYTSTGEMLDLDEQIYDNYENDIFEL